MRQLLRKWIPDDLNRFLVAAVISIGCMCLIASLLVAAIITLLNVYLGFYNDTAFGVFGCTMGMVAVLVSKPITDWLSY